MITEQTKALAVYLQTTLDRQDPSISPHDAWAAAKMAMDVAPSLALIDDGSPFFGHDRLCAQIAARFGGHRSGFASRLRELFDDDYGIKFVPDVFMVSERLCTIDCIEVEIEARMKIDKIRRYGKLWQDADCEGWDFRLWVVDRYAHMHEVSPSITYAALLAHVKDEIQRHASGAAPT